MKAVYKFHWDCGRQGNLEGVFVAEQNEVEDLIGEEVYFGEVLGKHSEVYGEISAEDVVLISADPIVVKLIEDHNLISGFNPLDYVKEEYEGQERDEAEPEHED